MDALNSNNEGSGKTVAFLKVSPMGEFPETIFPIREGENTVGRQKKCSITIPLLTVSRKHASIVVEGKSHWIVDCFSMNKTRRNKMFLKPKVFYELVHGVELEFADVVCQYFIVQSSEDVTNMDNSVSSTSTPKAGPVEITVKLTKPAITPEDGSSFGSLSLRVTAQEDIPEGKVSKFEISKGRTSGNKTEEVKVSEGENTWDKVPKGQIPVGDVPNNDMLEETPKVETVATQANGLILDSLLETGDELATQGYGVEDGISVRVPELSSVFNVPSAINTQVMNEADGRLEVREATVTNEAVEVVGNQDENEKSESSDGNLPSLAKMIGIKSDGESDFMATRQTSKKKINTKSTSERTKTPVKTTRDDENTLGTQKRCYLECPAVEGEEPGARNRPAKGRKRSTTRRGKVEQGTLEDTAGVTTRPVGEHRVNEEATSSSRNENTPEDKDEQRGTTHSKVDQILEHGESKGEMKEANIVNKTELEGGKTSRKGRGRKRKSSENINEGVEQNKQEKL